MVFSCLDNVPARYAVNARAAEAGAPLVVGGLGSGYAFCCDGSVQVFDARRSLCYACTLSPDDERAAAARLRGAGLGCDAAASLIEEAGGVPTTIMMASIIAGQMALEGMKIVSQRAGRLRPEPGARFSYSLLDSRAPSLYLRDPAAREGCPFHGLRPIDPDAVVELSGGSDALTPSALLRRAEASWGPGVAVELPSAIYRLGAGGAARWRSELNLLHRALQRGLDVPGEATEVDDGRWDVYDAAAPRCEQTLRALAFPWMQAYPVTDLGGEVRGWLTPAGDRARLGVHP